MAELKTTVDIDEEALTRFRAAFPQRGALKWFVNRFMDNFMRVYNPESLDEVFEEAMEQTLAEAEDEL